MVATADLLVRITSDVKDAVKGIGDVEGASSKAHAGIKAAAVPAAAALAAVGAAAISAGKAAAEDAAGAAILAQNLKNSTGATDAQVAATEDHIAAMSKATGVADDQLRPALSNLVMATGDVTTAQSALGVAMDVAAATGKDVETVSAAMAKAYAGNTASLGKLVPSLDKATLASGDMDAVMAELAQTTGGSAAAAAGTAAGQMQIMTNNMGEAQEEIGTALLPIMSMLAGVLGEVASVVQKNSKVVQVLVAVVGALALAVLAVNAAMKVYQATLIVVQVVQKATWLSALGPIGLVIAAVALVIGIVVLLWHRSETFRDIVLGVWGAIKSAATNTAGAIKSAWEGAISFISNAWRTVREVVSGIIDGIRSAWANMVGAIKSAMGGLAAILRAPFDAVRSAIDLAAQAVQSLVSWLGKIHVPDIHLPHIPGTRAAPAVATPAVPMARGAAASTAAGPGVTIVVNGAIDPDAPARQIRRILSGHDRRIGLAG